MTMKNKIFLSRILKTLLVLLSASLLITCDQLFPKPSRSDNSAPTYTVTYNGNNADSGSAPSDGNSYANGATVTVLDNSGNLARSGYSFIGWNTEADGEGTSYTTNNTFTMGSANVTLHANWSLDPTYTVTYDGNNHESGEPPIDNNNYEEGQTVTVSSGGDLGRPGYVFSHWNTKGDGSGTSYTGGNTFSMGAANVRLYAQWDYLTYSTLLGADIDGEAGNDQSGGAVSLNSDGSIVAIGARYHDIFGASNIGNVRMYD